VNGLKHQKEKRSMRFATSPAFHSYLSLAELSDGFFGGV
jgi:hypothetical protein